MRLRSLGNVIVDGRSRYAQG